MRTFQYRIHREAVRQEDDVFTFHSEGNRFCGIVILDVQNGQVGGVHAGNGHSDFNRLLGFNCFVDECIRQGDVHCTDFAGFSAHCSFDNRGNLFRLDRNSGDFRILRNRPGRHFNLEVRLFQLDLLFVDANRGQGHVLFHGGFRRDILALIAVEPAVYMLLAFRMIREFADRLTAAAGTGLTPVTVFRLRFSKQPGEPLAERRNRLLHLLIIRFKDDFKRFLDNSSKDVVGFDLLEVLAFGFARFSNNAYGHHLKKHHERKEQRHSSLHFHIWKPPISLGLFLCQQ